MNFLIFESFNDIYIYIFFFSVEMTDKKSLLELKQCLLHHNDVMKWEQTSGG